MAGIHIRTVIVYIIFQVDGITGSLQLHVDFGVSTINIRMNPVFNFALGEG